MSAPRYTREVGRKFHPDGTPRRFPGNTIICFVEPDSPLGAVAQAFQQALGAVPLGHKFALLPPPSFHMTVMELLCDEVRTPERWSPLLPLDAPLAATDAFFLERVPPITAPSHRTVRVTGIAHLNHLWLTLEPADEATAAALHAYRNAVAGATQVRFPDHDRYQFHLSLAYRLIELDAGEEEALAALANTWQPRLRAAGASIALPPPVLTGFDDMFRFTPLTQPETLASRWQGG
jgi:hypothetical protein